jgi:hypothetical protein
MDKQPNLKILLIVNFILHFISACMAGVWISELVSSSGAMTPLAWFETVLAVIAISIGLSALSYIGIKHTPTLPQSVRGAAKAAFMVGYSAIAAVLLLAAASVLGAPAGERAHVEYAHQEFKTETELRRRAVSTIENRLPFLIDCENVGDAMSTQEGATGAFSREGGDVGRVAITLSNIADGCRSARNAIYANRAYLARQFARADRILIDMRRVIDSDKDRHQKMIEVRALADQWQRVMRGINDALATETLMAASEGLTKDWRAAGLPVAAANAIAQNFDGLADALVEGLEDIAAMKERPLPGIPVVSNIAYLGMYPDATLSALAIGAIIEVIPLAVILLGMSMMERANTPRVATLPIPTATTSHAEIGVRPKRSYKRRVVNGDARN